MARSRAARILESSDMAGAVAMPASENQRTRCSGSRMGEIAALACELIALGRDLHLRAFADAGRLMATVT